MKKWYHSKTIIVNIIAAFLGIIPLIDVNLLTTIGIVNVTGYLSVLGFITTILNLFLRMITTGQTISRKRRIGIKTSPKEIV